MKDEILVNLIAQIIFDKKGFNITAIDLRGVATLTDFMIIAEGGVDRHVQAIAHEVVAKLSEVWREPNQTEGRENGDWIVLDYGSVMVHLFAPGLRDKYRLENLWPEAKIVDLRITQDPVL